MATHLWRGTADRVAQVSTVQITGYDATTTYKVTIGGVVISTVGTGGTAATTASALKVLLAASTHPYFTAIAFTVNTDTITMTANEPGVPFVATSSVTGGAGTIGSVTAVTANAGPNIWAATNFSTGTLPANTDTVIFENSNVPVLWGLDQSAVTLAELRIMASYTGFIGLPEGKFATETEANLGETRVVYSETTKPEYRDCYLKIGATLCNLGHGNGTCSPRLKINFGTVQTATTVYNGRSTGLDENLEPTRLLGTHASNVLNVYGGVVGVATSTGSEVGTTLTNNIYGGTVYLGGGVTHTTSNVYAGGTLYIRSAGSSANIRSVGGQILIDVASGTVSSITAYTGGTVTTSGGFTATSMGAAGGTIITKAGDIGQALAGGGGLIDMSQTAKAFTVSVWSITNDGRIITSPLVTYSADLIIATTSNLSTKIESTVQ